MVWALVKMDHLSGHGWKIDENSNEMKPLDPLASTAAKRETTEGKNGKQNQCKKEAQEFHEQFLHLGYLEGVSLPEASMVIILETLGTNNKLLAVHDGRAHKKQYVLLMLYVSKYCISYELYNLMLHKNPCYDHLAAGDDNKIGWWILNTIKLYKPTDWQWSIINHLKHQCTFLLCLTVGKTPK